MTPEPRLAPGGWLDRPAVKTLFAVLDRDGEELRAVGGAVRNALIGRAIGDIDFATTATPDVTMARAAAAGLKAVPTGVEHGTVTVLIDGTGYEITTLRRDVETDGRHARVLFGRDWGQDAERRDFTMNALYADAAGRVHDPTGGYPDLLAGRVRFIGDAQTRIREDTLRILRFFRFSAEYGCGSLDREGLQACIRERRGLDRLSRERVRQELMRLLVARYAVPVVEAMTDAGLAQQVLRGVPRLGAFGRLAAIEEALALEPHAILRLAALGLRIVEDAERLAEALRLSRREAAVLEGLARLAPRLSPGLSEGALEILLYGERESPVADASLLAWAMAGAPVTDEGWRALHAKARGWAPPTLPFKGGDLVALGLEPGPRMGEVLRELERWWIEAGFPSDPETIEGALRRAAERAAPPA